jgi:hypothetical protein
MQYNSENLNPNLSISANRKSFSCFILFIAFFILSPRGFGQLTDLPFQHGEKLQYRVSYNWEFIWVDAGKVEFEVKEISFDGQPAFHFKSFGRSLTAYDWIYKVRDSFESMALAESLQPIWYLRNTSEGSYKVNNRLDFDAKNGVIVASSENSSQTISSDTLKYDPNIFDLQTAVYYARSLNFSKLHEGDKIPIPVIIDGEVYDLHGKYHGIELIENYDGEIYRCYHFSATLVGGTIFNEGETADIWVTSDKNKIPILVEAKILIGSVKAYFVKASKLKYPVEALVE